MAGTKNEAERNDRQCWNELVKYMKGLANTDGMMIPILQKIQQLYGYLPRSVMKKTAEFLDIPGSQIMGVATFYAQFRFTPTGRNLIKVCHGTACHVSGADMISETVMSTLNIGVDETTSDLKYTFTKVACLGCCSLAPVMMINDDTFGRLTPDKIRQILKDYQG
ncbi:MAG: NADH-quinone oxidoreductase subunit NuoE [Candidatus Delongbacteria bacterium]|nr:NADH-quinone oxidoreductase subunit NuoE [Candidatus Delongbacteria bacterium]